MTSTKYTNALRVVHVPGRNWLHSRRSFSLRRIAPRHPLACIMEWHVNSEISLHRRPPSTAWPRCRVHLRQPRPLARLRARLPCPLIRPPLFVLGERPFWSVLIASNAGCLERRRCMRLVDFACWVNTSSGYSTCITSCMCRQTELSRERGSANQWRRARRRDRDAQ